MSILVVFALLFQAISPFTTITVVENMPKYHNSSAFGVATCEYNKVHIEVWRSSNIQTLLHEFAHAYDCLDNGIFDGSPINDLCEPSLDCAEAYARKVEYTLEYK